MMSGDSEAKKIRVEVILRPPQHHCNILERIMMKWNDHVTISFYPEYINRVPSLPGDRENR